MSQPEMKDEDSEEPDQPARDKYGIAQLLEFSEKNNHELENPALMVIGMESSGKSTLINRIIGMEVCPMAEGRMTKCPITYEVVSDGKTYSVDGEVCEEKGFLGKLTEKMSDMKFTSKPINCKIPGNGRGLFLIDTPGFVATNEDEWDTIMDIIRSVAQRKPHILAVSTAQSTIGGNAGFMAVDRIIKEVGHPRDKVTFVMNKSDNLNIRSITSWSELVVPGSDFYYLSSKWYPEHITEEEFYNVFQSRNNCANLRTGFMGLRNEVERKFKELELTFYGKLKAMLRTEMNKVRSMGPIKTREEVANESDQLLRNALKKVLDNLYGLTSGEIDELRATRTPEEVLMGLKAFQNSVRVDFVGSAKSSEEKKRDVDEKVVQISEGISIELGKNRSLRLDFKDRFSGYPLLDKVVDIYKLALYTDCGPIVDKHSLNNLGQRDYKSWSQQRVLKKLVQRSISRLDTLTTWLSEYLRGYLQELVRIACEISEVTESVSNALEMIIGDVMMRIVDDMMEPWIDEINTFKNYMPIDITNRMLMSLAVSPLGRLTAETSGRGINASDESKHKMECIEELRTKLSQTNEFCIADAVVGGYQTIPQVNRVNMDENFIMEASTEYYYMILTVMLFHLDVLYDSRLREKLQVENGRNLEDEMRRRLEDSEDCDTLTQDMIETNYRSHRERADQLILLEGLLRLCEERLVRPEGM